YMNLSGARIYFNRKARLAKHLNHCVIRRNYLSFECLNSIRGGDFGQLPQQQGPQSTSLEVIGDGEGHLGALFINAGIESMPDHLFFGAAQGYQTKGASEVGFEAR